MIHPDTELRFISEEIGFGVVATKLIPKGTITWVSDLFDIKITDKMLNDMKNEFQEIVYKYGYREPAGSIVLCWDLAKYVNHSFRPSCISTPYDFEIAIRDIAPGEELTDDYGTLNILKEFKCLPEEGISRLAVYPDDLKRHYREWDAIVADAIKYLDKCQQPLRKYLSEETFQRALEVAKGNAPSESLLNSLYVKNKV